MTLVAPRSFVPPWLIVFVVSVALAPLAAWAQTGPQARAAQVQRVGGTVEARRGATGPWTRLRPGGELLRGDSVRTYPASFAQLNFDVGGQWQLAAESELDLTPAVTDGPGRITVRLERGGVVARWRPDQQVGQTPRLTVATPSGQAGILGTEWSLRVEPDGTSTLLVLDGRVDFGNEFGSVRVAANEAAEMAVGRKPSLLRLLSPEDRVQWVAAYQPNPARYSVGGDASANTELIQADALIGAGDTAAARARVEAGQRQFPADARFDALLSRLALFEGESAVSRAAADAAVAKDTRAVDGWLALGEWGIRDGDLTLARRGFTEAGFVAPQDGRAWFGLGTIASDREEFPSAKRFLGNALRLDPVGPGYRGQLGLTYTLANQLGLAAREYAAALEQQPDDYVSLAGLALLALKQGRDGEAVELLQRVTLFEPRYARAHMYLGVAYYRQRRHEDAIGELQRASREDPRDPLPYMMLTQIHTDLFEPWKAIEAARAAQTRMPYLKSFNQLSNTVKGGANLGNALAVFGLDEWAEHLAHDSYDPLWAGSHLFLGDRYRTRYVKESAYYRGVLTDPTVFGGSPGYQPLLPRPGTYVTGALLAQTGKGEADVRQPTIVVNGFSTRGRGVSYLLNLSGARVNAPAYGTDRTITSNGQVTAAAGVVLSSSWAMLGTFTHDVVDGKLEWREFIEATFDLGLSTSRAEIGVRRRTPRSLLLARVETARDAFRAEDQDSVSSLPFTTHAVQVSHDVSLADGHRFAWGAEAYTVRVDMFSREFANAPEIEHLRFPFATAYVSSAVAPFPALRLEGALFVNRIGGDSQMRGTTVGPRAGVSVRLGRGVARAAYIDWSKGQGTSTLSPVTVAGVALDDRSLQASGRLKLWTVQVETPAWDRIFAQAFVRGATQTSRESEESIRSFRKNHTGGRDPAGEVAQHLRSVAGLSFGGGAANDSSLDPVVLTWLSHNATRFTVWGGSVNGIVTRQLSVRGSMEQWTPHWIRRETLRSATAALTVVSGRRVSLRGGLSHAGGSLVSEPDVSPVEGWTARGSAFWETSDKRWAAAVEAHRALGAASPVYRDYLGILSGGARNWALTGSVIVRY